MKRILLFGIAIVALLSCSKNNRGELVGASTGKAWMPEQPSGMSLIPAGSFTMGSSDYDVASTMISPSKTVSVASFYIDETEITNNEYRQFVFWVRDSIIRYELALAIEENEPDETVSRYSFVVPEDVTAEGEEESTIDIEDKDKSLNWAEPIVWDDIIAFDRSMNDNALMDSLYLPREQSANGERLFNVDVLKYTYTWLDIKKAIKEKGKRADYVRSEELLIYPDTTVWVNDFTYSFNEPMHDQYFWHAAYNDYPVVGVTFDQAKAFCNWRTKIKNDYLRSQGEPSTSAFRLPTEAEWEYAARGGLEYATYPWGGPYPDDDRGCFMANYKPMRGDYLADNALYTAQADAYYPNGYGLYNMAGNVSEWTNTAYDVSSYYFVSTMNPNYEDENNNRKVIRGGSWKDVAYYLQVSSRDYEYKDSARSYIGFRTVQSFQGTNNY